MKLRGQQEDQQGDDGLRRQVVLINPNTSLATTEMMPDIARRTMGDAGAADIDVHGLTVALGPTMVTDEDALRAAAVEVLAAAQAYLADDTHRVDAFIISAFGDPGATDVRALTGIWTIGIAEAAISEAAMQGRRFGIATTTPGLERPYREEVHALGFDAQFSGIRFTPGSPTELAADADLLQRSLADAVEQCVRRDGAEAVIIAGGTLADAAEALHATMAVPVIAPIPAACRLVLERIHR